MSIVSYNITLWRWYLWISGVLLEYNKTQYCIMIWGFIPHGKPYRLPKAKLPENKVYIKGTDG
eukprot:8550024-Ditylum_brightwellii.AAC.1